jgi:3-mercaptopyruvate sulfurtransferase SseA
MLLRYKLSRSLSTFSLRRCFATAIANRVFIETNELEELMKENTDDKLSILNASLTRPDYNPKADHIAERITGSVYFSIEELSDPENPIPLMMPP